MSSSLVLSPSIEVYVTSTSNQQFLPTIFAAAAPKKVKVNLGESTVSSERPGEPQSIEICITDTDVKPSLAHHLAGIFAAAGPTKVIVCFGECPVIVNLSTVEPSTVESSATNPFTEKGAAVDPCNQIIQYLKHVDIHRPSIVNLARRPTGFNDLSLEMQINIMKFVFTDDNPQGFKINHKNYDRPAIDADGKVAFSALNLRLRRVSKIWNVIGHQTVFDNTFQVLQATSTLWAFHQDLDRYARHFFKGIKHLAISPELLNQSQLQRLKRFRMLQDVDFGCTGIYKHSEPCLDQARDGRANVVQYLPKAADDIYNVLLKESLKSVRYMWESKHLHFRDKEGFPGQREMQTRILFHKIVASADGAMGWAIETKTRQVWNWRDVMGSKSK